MKYRYFNCLALILISFQISFAQQMPIDFSDASENFSVWGGSGFSTRTSPMPASLSVSILRRDSALLLEAKINVYSEVNLALFNNLTLLPK